MEAACIDLIAIWFRRPRLWTQYEPITFLQFFHCSILTINALFWDFSTVSISKFLWSIILHLNRMKCGHLYVHMCQLFRMRKNLNRPFWLYYSYFMKLHGYFNIKNNSHQNLFMPWQAFVIWLSGLSDVRAGTQAHPLWRTKTNIMFHNLKHFFH